jgi:hypothetical protein
MDRRLELVDALLTLGKQAEHVAKLLSEDLIGNLRDDVLLTPTPNSNKTIDINRYSMWPDASDVLDPLHRAQFDAANILPLADLNVLEYAIGVGYPIAHFHQHAKVTLVTNDFKFQTQPPNVKIVNSFSEAGNSYDIGILWETLEFDNNPALTLIEMKQRCKRIIIRFRPWTSRDGAFQSYFFNKAYAQLIMPIDHKVKFKVIRPLATYETLLAKAQLAIIDRKINSSMPEGYLQMDNIIQVAIERTWGNIHTDEAIKIMMTDSIDYMVSS